MFSKYPKSHQVFGLLLKDNLSPRTLKNHPIWSHWFCPKVEFSDLKMSLRNFIIISVFEIVIFCCCCCLPLLPRHSSAWKEIHVCSVGLLTAAEQKQPAKGPNWCNNLMVKSKNEANVFYNIFFPFLVPFIFFSLFSVIGTIRTHDLL